jgi:hypothetical protein
LSDFYDFNERLQFSEGIGLTAEILHHIQQHIPAAVRITKANNADDRNGTDFWVHRAHDLPPVSIDLKNRELCPIAKRWGDDVCIETTSVYRGPNKKPFTDNFRDTPGWTLNESKRTDLVVYTWPHSADLFGAPRLRYWILYFPFLCSASLKHWREWIDEYGEKATSNERYLTLNTYVPRTVVAAAIKQFTSGVVTA